MKIKLTKDQWAALPSHVQAFCAAAGDAFEMDAAQIPDATALKNAKQHEVDAHKTTKKALADITGELATAKTELATFQDLATKNVPKANLEAIEQSYKDKIAKMEKDHSTATKGLEASLEDLLVGREASKLAGDISTVPSLLESVIRSRLKVDTDSGGKHVTRVLDANGKPSALTLEDLKKDLLANKEFAPILKGTKANGSSAPGAGPGSSAPGSQSQQGQNNLARIPATDLVARLEAKGVGAGVEE